MVLCEDCEDRETCRSLCAEAELYVGQDHVGPEKIMGQDIIERIIDNNDTPWDYQTDWEDMSLEARHRLLIGLRKSGLTIRQISELVPISYPRVWFLLKKFT